MCNCNTYQEIVDFGNLKSDWLRKYLPYKNGIPSHDTINRVLSITNVRYLEKMFINYSNYEINLPNGTLINVDGKRLIRGARKKRQQAKKGLGGKRVLDMMNVYCSEFYRCLDSVSVSNKSTEKKGSFEILEMLSLSECLHK